MELRALDKFSGWFRARPAESAVVGSEKKGFFDKYTDYKLKKNQQKIDSDIKQKELAAKSKSNMKLYSGVALGGIGGAGAYRGYNNYKEGKSIIS